MSDIKRYHVGARLSEATVHNGTVYLAGQVAVNSAGQDIRSQTTEVLAAIDKLLAEAGSHKSRILRTEIILADMSDFDGMNEVWGAWVVPGHTPPRATIQARLAKPDWRVEMIVTAAVGPAAN